MEQGSAVQLSAEHACGRGSLGWSGSALSALQAAGHGSNRMQTWQPRPEGCVPVERGLRRGIKTAAPTAIARARSPSQHRRGAACQGSPSSNPSVPQTSTHLVCCLAIGLGAACRRAAVGQLSSCNWLRQVGLQRSAPLLPRGHNGTYSG